MRVGVCDGMASMVDTACIEQRINEVVAVQTKANARLFTEQIKQLEQRQNQQQSERDRCMFAN